jgi:hypothetical protein
VSWLRPSIHADAIEQTALPTVMSSARISEHRRQMAVDLFTMTADAIEPEIADGYQPSERLTLETHLPDNHGS